MPSHRSAEKAVRKTLLKTAVNKARKNRIRSFVRNVEDVVASFGKDVSVTKASLNETLVAAEKELMRGVSKGVLHKNAAARKVSRLNSKIRKATAELAV
ncbi:MAG: 30S ribosomal protein S20 [Holosporales bacterium]|jgi:small subunit ribosomal protein S20|nr:30S ribosomal protein S20 [Holosporales bacterium]